MVTNRELIRKMLEKENVEALKKVREYLKKHPLASIMEVSMNTGVSHARILGFVNYGILRIRLPKAG